MGIPDKLLNGLNRLEPLPMTVQRLLIMLQQEDVSTNAIVEVIEYDSAVAANILRAANSAAFGGRFQIERMRDAVLRLGINRLLDIVLGDHLKSLKVAAPLYDLTEDDLWLHGAAASLAVKAMIRETGNSVIPDSATIAALVHDIGKLIMVRYLDADVSKIVSFCSGKNVTWVAAEREIFGCDHAEVGGAMAIRWGFPEPITSAIERHHQDPTPSPGAMLDAVMLANLAAKSVGVGLGAAGLNMTIDYDGCRDRLGLSVEGFERVCAQTAIWIKDLRPRAGNDA